MNSYFMYLNSATCFDLTAIFRDGILYNNTQDHNIDWEQEMVPLKVADCLKNVGEYE